MKIRLAGTPLGVGSTRSLSPATCSRPRPSRGGLRFLPPALLLALSPLPALLAAPLAPSPAGAQEKTQMSVTVPFALDHNRMLVTAQIKKADGKVRDVRLWVDTGNPDFFISEPLARELGISIPGTGPRRAPLDITPPTSLRLGGMPLNLEGVKAQVMFAPAWLFSSTHADGNLPAGVLKHYRVIFDYPQSRLTLAPPGDLPARGIRVPASVNAQTGIVQIDTVVDGDTLSFAIDNGASYSFTKREVVDRLISRHADWPVVNGAIGCANIWGWWEGETTWPVLRVPEIWAGDVSLAGVGLVALPSASPPHISLIDWYSRKTARPVAGFLGPNALRPYRVEIDYVGGGVSFEKGAEPSPPEMDLVGITLQPQADGSYKIIGITQKEGQPSASEVHVGDVLLKVGDLEATGNTMGAVVDALRGNPGDTRKLVLKRVGIEIITVQAKVGRFL